MTDRSTTETGGAAWLFELDGDRFAPTPSAAGPWSPDALQGGPPTGLLARAVERCDSGGRDAHEFMLARLSVELVRPVPMRPLSVISRVSHPGKRIQRVTASLVADGVEVANAIGVRVRVGVPDGDHAQTGGLRAPALPETSSDPPATVAWPAFHSEALEYRVVTGEPWKAGPATVWIRLRHQLVAGEQTSPLVRAATCSDMGILGWDLTPSGDHAINTDIITHFARVPVGEWLCLDARTVLNDPGIGWVETHMFDSSGLVGRIDQTMVPAPPAPWDPTDKRAV